LPLGDVVIFLAAPDELFALDNLPAVSEVFLLFVDVPVLLLFDGVSSLFTEVPVLLLSEELPPPEFLAFKETPFALLDFDDLPVLPVFFVPAFPEVLVFDEVFFPPLLNISLTASAATFKTPTAAPCAAPVRISPAASFTLSIMPGDELFLVLFDFAEIDFLAVGFLVSFFVAIMQILLA
jgi:hypothetical protein